VCLLVQMTTSLLPRLQSWLPRLPKADTPVFSREIAISELTHPGAYVATQQLGSQMRDSDVQAFEYRSARDPGQGINVVLYTPKAFTSKGPEWQQSWICETQAEKVAFYNRLSGPVSFGLDQFLVNGRLPTPAACPGDGMKAAPGGMVSRVDHGTGGSTNGRNTGSAPQPGAPWAASAPRAPPRPPGPAGRRRR
jgi:hypothetical protein